MTDNDYNLISGFKWLANEKCRNYHDAEDVMQDSFLKILNNLKTFERLEFEAKKRYVYKTITNACLDLFKGRATKKRKAAIVDLPNCKRAVNPEVYSIMDLKDVCNRAQKNKYCKPLFLLTAGYSITEISEGLQLRENTTLQHIFKARKFLKAA